MLKRNQMQAFFIFFPLHRCTCGTKSFSAMEVYCKARYLPFYEKIQLWPYYRAPPSLRYLLFKTFLLYL